MSNEFQNECAVGKCRDRTQPGKSSLVVHPTFEEWLRTLAVCPDLLESVCREAKTILDFPTAKAALDRWQADGFPRQEEPPERWRNDDVTFTKKWVDLYLQST